MDLLPVGTDFQIKRRGEDPRFQDCPLRVPAGVLRGRKQDVVSPQELAKRHAAYRQRIIMGPTYRADMWALLEGEPALSRAELARRATADRHDTERCHDVRHCHEQSVVRRIPKQSHPLGNCQANERLTIYRRHLDDPFLVCLFDGVSEAMHVRAEDEVPEFSHRIRYDLRLAAIDRHPQHFRGGRTQVTSEVDAVTVIRESQGPYPTRVKSAW